MYFIKELFVNGEIKTIYNRLNKLQTIGLFSFILSVTVAAVAVIITLAVKFPKTFMFMTGYAVAIYTNVLFVIMVLIGVPSQRNLDLLRNKQTEELKGQPIYEKYTELLQAGRKLSKITNCIAISAVAISIIGVWVLTVTFPYSLYNIYTLCFPILVCSLILLICRDKIQKIKALEAEILQELHKKSEKNSLLETEVAK